MAPILARHTHKFSIADHDAVRVLIDKLGELPEAPAVSMGKGSSKRWIQRHDNVTNPAAK